MKGNLLLTPTEVMNRTQSITAVDVLGKVLTIFVGDLFIQISVDIVQVSQHTLRQLNNLLVPVRLGHLKERRVENRQNDRDVVTD